MSRAGLTWNAFLLVLVTGLIMVSGMAAVGSPAIDRQHTGTQAETDATSPGERLNSADTNTTSPTSDDGWTMSRANAANTNHINTTGPTNPITIRWKVTTDLHTFAVPPVVKNGTVYFGTRHYGHSKQGEPDGRLYAVDAWTGKVRWTFTTASNGYPNSIAVLKDTVYIGGQEGNVWALDAATGEEFWSFRTNGKVRMIKVSNRTVYVGDWDWLYALGALRGEEKWAFRPRGLAGYPTGWAVKDGTVYASWRYGNITAVDAETGTVNWNVGMESDFPPAPVVANGIVYRQGSSELRALDAETGEERWSRPGGPAPAVLGNTAYFTANKSLLAVDAQTGEVRWRSRSLRKFPVLLNDIGYIRQDKTLYTLNPTTGDHHARFTPPPFNNRGDEFASPMAVFNGSLYMGVGIDEKTSGKSNRNHRTIFYALGTPEFTYRNLSVTPQSPDPGESVTVTATVANTGTGPGEFNATFTVDGKGVNVTSGRLAAGASRTITFTYVFDNAGAYSVGIGGHTRNIGVGEATPAPTATPTPTPTATATATATGAQATVATTTTSTPGFGVVVLVVAVAVLALLVGSRK